MTFVTGFWSHGARGPARPWGECTVARIPWAVASLLRLHRPALPRTAQRSREAAPPGPRAMKAGTETGAVQELAQASSGHTPGRDRLKLPLGKRSYCTRQATMRDSDAKGCGNRTWARKEGLRLSCCQRRPRGPHLRVRCSTGNGGCGGRPGAQLPHRAEGPALPQKGDHVTRRNSERHAGQLRTAQGAARKPARRSTSQHVLKTTRSRMTRVSQASGQQGPGAALT